MDYSQFKTKYKSKKEGFDKKLESLELEKRETELAIQQLENDYAKILASMGLKEGAKVKVRFPDEGTISGYIHLIKIFDSGNVELFVSLPSITGKRLKRVTPYSNSYYTGIKPEWVTILPDDYNFGAN